MNFRTIRIIDGGYYLKNFSSDRRHMKSDNGQFVVSPPPWPILFCSDKGHNLNDFIDMENHKLASNTKEFNEDDFQQGAVLNYLF
uniref:Protein N-terminal glutamine amidohydrolase n=1 Tax=Syphacia muris TaxID=451379 RepID=A0A0N5AHV9_9BILA